jgi:hypothetical protein
MKLTLKSRSTQWRLAAGQLLSTVPLLLMSWGAFAANLEEGAAAQPVEVVSIWFVALFLILFFGMIIGYFAYVWWSQKNKKQAGNSPNPELHRGA